jgi:drug/metabolite transporter (DMT)-like permease
MKKSMAVNFNNRDEFQGLMIGLLAIIAFSVTLPATRLAVTYIDPTLVGLGRSLFVALPALMLLLFLKVPLPGRKQCLQLSVVSFGVVLGFPWLTSLSMQEISGARGGIVVSMIPLFTAIVGAYLSGQKPSVGFWLIAVSGSALVLIYLSISQQGNLEFSEFILLGASVLCAIGYAQGGKLAGEMGGVAVICWALVLSIPFSFFLILYVLLNNSNDTFSHAVMQVPWQAWSSFLYLSIVSQWVAFILWYKALALGGVVRVSQVQLIQPFLTIVISAILLGETISLLMMVFAVAVVITVGLGRRMSVHVTS